MTPREVVIRPPAAAFAVVALDDGRVVPCRFTAVIGDVELDIEADDERPTVRVRSDGKVELHAGRLRRLALEAAAVPSGSVERRAPYGLVGRDDYVRALERLPAAPLVSDGGRRRRSTVVEVAAWAARARPVAGTDLDRAQALGLSRSAFYRRKRRARELGVW